MPANESARGRTAYVPRSRIRLSASQFAKHFTSHIRRSGHENRAGPSSRRTRRERVGEAVGVDLGSRSGSGSKPPQPSDNRG